MSSKKRPRDQSLIDVYRQSAAIAIVVDEECDSKALPTNSAAKPIDDKLVEGNDVNQTKDNLYKNSELVDVASSFHAVGTGDAKYSLPRCPPAIVSSARSAVREKYISLQHTESCDKAIVSVFGVIISFQVSPQGCGGTHKLSRTYTLVDPTRPSLQCPTILHIFANTIDEFPHSIRAGDVIRCTDVKVDIYNGFPKLIGSDRNRSSFVLFHKKVDNLTGFSRPSSECNGHNDFQNSWGLPSSDWSIHSTHIRNIPCASTAARVIELSTWSERVFLQSPLGEKSMCELTLGQVLTYTSQQSKDTIWSQAVMGGRCDVTCMVAATVQRMPGDTHNDARNMVHGPSTLLLWDGSTPGELSSHGAVDTANFNDMRKSLRSATLFPVLTTERSWTSLTDFQNEIDQPCLLPECLLGMPLAVSCASHDSVTAARLNGMKPGTWLRLRNLHIDKGAVETVYVSSSSSKTPPSAANTSSSSSSVSSGIAGDHSDISGSTRTHIVGTVRADTQISVLLPYFRDVGLKVISYGEKCESIRARAEPASPCLDLLAARAPRITRHISNSKGILYSNLALCLSKKPPNKFLSKARIVYYLPADVSRFVCCRPDAKGKDGPPSFVFRFSLRIADDTAVTDVLLFDKEAEFFLDTTAEEFHSNQAVRDKVEQRLNELSERPSKGIVKGPEGRVVIMDFMLTSYVSKVAIDGAHRNALQLAVSQTCIMPSAVDCVDDDIVTTL